jgi:hypothetical protein
MLRVEKNTIPINFHPELATCNFYLNIRYVLAKTRTQLISYEVSIKRKRELTKLALRLVP